MSERADRFLRAYNAIEHHLRALANGDRRTPFYRVIERAARRNAVANRYEDDLKEFADLRNAIIHERGDGHLIAEPTEQAVIDIERILMGLQHAPTVLPLFRRGVFTMKTDQPVAMAARLLAERNFSQVPVYDGDIYVGLMTTDDIARWLGRCMGEEPINLWEVPLIDVLECTQDHENVGFAGPEMTLQETLEAFQTASKSGRRLEAILITDSGQPDGSLLGIITPLDIPQIYESLEQ